MLSKFCDFSGELGPFFKRRKFHAHKSSFSCKKEKKRTKGPQVAPSWYFKKQVAPSCPKIAKFPRKFVLIVKNNLIARTYNT